MNRSSLHLLESAAFAAWPALAQEDVLGWNLRYSDGYTKRANSANALLDAVDLVPRQIELIEQRFRDRLLQPIFRLASFVAPPNIDRLLATRRYAKVDPTWVMQRLLSEPQASTVPPKSTSPRAWLAAFQQASGKQGPDQAIHLRMLQHIQCPRVFAQVMDGDVPVCCGLAVAVGDQLGLFDIVTAASHRRRGLARQLCDGLIAWGHMQGAKSAFLQVTASNSAAIALYQAMGFRTVYDYWYRIAPTTVS